MEIRQNLLFICIFCFCHQFLWIHATVRPSSQNTAIVTNKVLHKNGLKEFTVLKRIKGNDCACACLCTSPDSVDGMAELHRVVLPGNQSLDRLIRPPIRYFQITKEIRANQCKCSCACSEPHDEVVMEFSHNSDHEQHQLNDVVSKNWTISSNRIDDEQRTTTLESHQTSIPITIYGNSSSSSNNRKTLRDSEDSIQMESSTQSTTAKQFIHDVGDVSTTVVNNNVSTVFDGSSSTVYLKETTQTSVSMPISDSSAVQEPTSAAKFKTITPSSSTGSSTDHKMSSSSSTGSSTYHKMSPSQSRPTTISISSSMASSSPNTLSTSVTSSSKDEEVPPTTQSRKTLSIPFGSSTVQESSTPPFATTSLISDDSSTVEELHVFTPPITTIYEQGAQNATNWPNSTMKNTVKIASGNDGGMKTKVENSTILDIATDTSFKTTPTVIDMIESTVPQQVAELDATVSSTKSEITPSTSTLNPEKHQGITNSTSIHLPSKSFEITKNESDIVTNSSEENSKIPIMESSSNKTVSTVLANNTVSSNFTIKTIENDTSPLPILEKRHQKSNFSTIILPTTGFKIAKNATQASYLFTVPSKMSTVLSKQHIVSTTAWTNTISDNIINTISATLATTESGTIQNTVPITTTNTVSVTMKNLTEILLGKELPLPKPSAKIGDDKQQNSTKSTTSTTLDPAFKARVANMLNKLKEQLYRLREEEKRKKVVTELEQEHKTNQEQLEKMAETQRTTLATIISNSGTITNVSKDRLSDYDTVSSNISSKAQINVTTQTVNNSNNLNEFTTVLDREFTNTTVIPDKNDTVASSKIKENTVSSKEKLHVVDSKSNAKSSIAPMDMSIDSNAEQMLQQHRQATTVVPKTVTVTQTTVSDTVASGFVIGNSSSSAEDGEDEKESLAKKSTKNGGSTVKLAENGENSTVKAGSEKADKENSTIKLETIETTTTLSPAFKARVANLLNRLKEQLYKMRELQEAMKEPSNSTVPSVQPIITVPTVSTTANSSLSSTMSVLEGLQKKMEKEDNSKITKNPTNEPKNSLVDSSNEEAPGFITEAPEIELTSTEIHANSTTYTANISQNLTNASTKATTFINGHINQSLDNHHINESSDNTKRPSSNNNDPPDNKLFPLSTDFGSQNHEDRRNRIILLPPPPQGSALFSSTLIGNESTNSPIDILSSASNNTELPHIGLQNAIEQTENFNEPSTTNISPEIGVTPTMSTTIIVGGATRKVPQAIPLTPLAPIAQSMIERLEMARKLREEQVKLEMMEAIRREQLGTDEIDPHLEERRREIETKLLFLAQTERFHREMLERQQNEQHRERSKSSEDRNTAAETVSENKQTEQRTDQQSPSVNVDALCDPVRRFLRQFRVDDPRRWMARNCRVARRHFPHASCGQIGVLLAKCVEQQKQQHRANIEDDSEEEGEEDRGD